LLARFNGFADAVEQKVDGAAHGMKHRCILEPDDCNDLSPRDRAWGEREAQNKKRNKENRSESAVQKSARVRAVKTSWTSLQRAGEGIHNLQHDTLQHEVLGKRISQ